MDSSSRDTLSKAFQKIIEQRRKMKRRKYTIRDEAKFHCTEFHLSVVHSYVLKLNINSDFRLLHTARFFNDTLYSMPGNSMLYNKMVATFMQDLQQFFMVPSPNQLFDREQPLKKNELAAAFISFLLQLLSHKTDLTDHFKDRIQTFQKELRFLLTLLGDESLLCGDHEKGLNLLEEFEGVANDAGVLVHSFLFSGDSVLQKMDEELDVLFNHIILLKDHIMEFSNLQPFIMTPKRASVDSLFVAYSLCYDLEDLLDQNDSRIVDVKDQIRILHQNLMLSLSLLKDIKATRRQEIEDLKEAKLQIRDVAYEAEYLINSYLAGDAPPWYFSIRLPHFIHKIKLDRAKLRQIKRDYGIGALEIAKDLTAQPSLQSKRGFEVDDDIIVGFDEKAMDVLHQLLGEREHLQVVSIFGMPGLGKTTLAKKLYNYPSFKYRFDRRSWCVVSQTYQRKSILIDILIRLTNELDKVGILNMEEESLVELIYKTLKGRRYLIVMDDIWSSSVRDDFSRCFPDDGNGSRILITSRHKDVTPPNSVIYKLHPLSNDQCWELLEKKLFYNKTCPPQLQRIGKEIATDCHGLPLAVVLIGGVLSTMENQERIWKNVKENLASYIMSDQSNSVMQILELSYRNLPEHLKPCFLYFGAFQEDAEIPVWKLKWLWIAEGFIHKEEKKSQESVAEEYLMELIDKSLVTISKRRSDGRAKTCAIHDLLRELCLRIAEEENFIKLIDNDYSIYRKHHHLYVHMNPISKSWPQFLRPFGLHVRSFFGSLPNSSMKVPNMKSLRILDFPKTSRDEDLKGTELLVHLRYLAIKCIPTSISSLMNLEFLVVEASEAVCIPSVVMKIPKLRYLRVTPEAFFDRNCNRSQINKLAFLSTVSIRELKDEEMLKCSPNLRKLKCLYKPFQVNRGARAVSNGKLKDKEILKYSPHFRRLNYLNKPFLVNKGPCRGPDLRFLNQLESLSMKMNGNGAEITEFNFPLNIKELTLDGLLLSWEKMSIIGGLPKLEILKLRSYTFSGRKWETRDGEFQQLRFLTLEEVNLDLWNTSSEHFPKLEKLVLKYCYNLCVIPPCLGYVPTLEMIQVDMCCKRIAKSAELMQEEQRDMGNEELKFIITSGASVEDLLSACHEGLKKALADNGVWGYNASMT